MKMVLTKLSQSSVDNGVCYSNCLGTNRHGSVWATSSTSVALFSAWEVDSPVVWERAAALPLFVTDVSLLSCWTVALLFIGQVAQNSSRRCIDTDILRRWAFPREYRPNK